MVQRLSTISISPYPINGKVNGLYKGVNGSKNVLDKGSNPHEQAITSYSICILIFKFEFKYIIKLYFL